MKNLKNFGDKMIKMLSLYEVCADLLIKGFPAFRSVSPHSPFDVVILKDGKLLSIEITKGWVNGDKEFYHKHSNHNFDYLAVWFADGKIKYIPELNP